MKIDTDVFSVNDTKKDLSSQDQKSNAKKTHSNVDTVTITANKELLVSEENKSAAQTDFQNIKQVQGAVEEVRGMLSKDFDTASDIHQLDNKSIVIVSKD